jgi:hypothetical protein
LFIVTFTVTQRSNLIPFMAVTQLRTEVSASSDKSSGLLPRILASSTPLFNIQDRRFRIDSDKRRNFARVIIWKEFGVTNSFTLENSFYGYQIGTDTLPFTPTL